MSCSKPVLIAIDGVSRDLIEKAQCGIYVEPENINSITDGMLLLSSMNKEKLKRMGNSGYEYSKKYFDREYLAKNFLQKISDII